MGTLFLKQASSFFQGKYKAARLAFTDVTEAELLVEEVTAPNAWSPDARLMTQIAKAAYKFDDYLRIVDVLHKRLYNIDWKQWRSAYNSLILIDFLITHGPEEFANEFRYDHDVIQELGRFEHIDDKGLDWGFFMRNKSESILKLLDDGEAFLEARSKAVKLATDIRGFGSSKNHKKKLFHHQPSSSPSHPHRLFSAKSLPSLVTSKRLSSSSSSFNPRCSLSLENDMTEVCKEKSRSSRNKKISEESLKERSISDRNSSKKNSAEEKDDAERELLSSWSDMEDEYEQGEEENHSSNNGDCNDDDDELSIGSGEGGFSFQELCSDGNKIGSNGYSPMKCEEEEEDIEKEKNKKGGFKSFADIMKDKAGKGRLDRQFSLGY